MTFSVSAFGALNQGSYDMFALHLDRLARARGIGLRLTLAGPDPNAAGPNAAGLPAPGRPLRGAALADAAKREQLCAAVAADAVAAGALESDVACMPCMSMTGFHDGVEAALGRKILRLSAALAAHYAGVENFGVIHMRPARDRIAEMFGARARVPDAAQAGILAAAEEEARRSGSPAPVEAAMLEIVEAWKAEGLTRVLFARADAPRAEESLAGRVPGVLVESYFGILAAAVADRAAAPSPSGRPRCRGPEA